MLHVIITWLATDSQCKIGLKQIKASARASGAFTCGPLAL